MCAAERLKIERWAWSMEIVFIYGSTKLNIKKIYTNVSLLSKFDSSEMNKIFDIS